MLISSYLVAVSGVELGPVYSIIGATAGSLMCYILPAAIYLKIDSQEKSRGMLIISVISIFFGIFISSSTLAALILHNV